MDHGEGTEEREEGERTVESKPGRGNEGVGTEERGEGRTLLCASESTTANRLEAIAQLILHVKSCKAE